MKIIINLMKALTTNGLTLKKILLAAGIMLLAFVFSANHALAMNASHSVQDGGPPEATGIWSSVSFVGGGPYTPGETVTLQAVVSSDDDPRHGNVRVAYNIDGGSYSNIINAPLSSAQLISAYSTSDSFAAPMFTGTYEVCMIAAIGNYSTNYINRCVDFTVVEPLTVGACGSIDGNSYLSNPNQSFACDAGTLTGWSGDLDGWTWTCEGAGGGSDAACSADRAYVGQCSSPSVLDTCETGSPYNTVVNAGLAGDTTTEYRWGCNGYNGGANTSATQCTLSKSANSDGQCGNAINKSYSAAPVGDPDLCISNGGNSSITQLGGLWQWSCLGQGTGSSEVCNAFVSSPSCQGGVPSNGTAHPGDTTTTATLSWEHSSSDTSRACEFSCNTGFSWNGSSCQSDTPAPAACGSAAGGTYTSVPTSNLCSAGAAVLGGGAVRNGDEYEWSCFVSGSGDPAARCTANYDSGGGPAPAPPAECGAAAGVPTSAWPTAGQRCTSGSANPSPHWSIIATADKDGVANYGPCGFSPGWCFYGFDYNEPPQQGDYDWSCGFFSPFGWGWQHEALCSAPYLDPDPVPLAPAVNATCDAGSIEVNFSSVGAASYNFRLDDETANGWNGSCVSPNAGDICIDGLVSDPYNATGTIGNSYRVWVEACNGSGSCSSDASESFTCDAPNQTPVVNAGADKALVLPESATSTTGTATDVDGPSPLIFNWTYIGGTGLSLPTITNGTTLNPTFSDMSAGTYEFRLSAFDGEATGVDSMITTVAAEPTYVLNVNNNGLAGSIGLTTSGDSGILCEGAGLTPPNNDCSEAYTQNSIVNLTANIANGSAVFSGGCTGTNSCVVTMTGAQSVTATYDCNFGFVWSGTACVGRYDLNVSNAGEVSDLITISSSPAGISCPVDCLETYDENESVTLTVNSVPDATTVFSGDCSGATCNLTMDSDKTVTVTTDCDGGFVWNNNTQTCDAFYIDLIPFGYSPFNSGADPVTGVYANVNIRLDVNNSGNEGFGASSVPHRVRLDALDSGLGSYNSAVGVGESFSTDNFFTNVPFGSYTLVGEINNEAVDAVGESDRTNNVLNDTFVLNPPPPPMGINTDPQITRVGQDVDVSWNLETAYEIDCTVQGPGIDTSFSHGPAGGNTDNSTSPITVTVTNFSQYELRCVEPITGVVYSSIATVEVVPDIQEI